MEDVSKVFSEVKEGSEVQPEDEDVDEEPLYTPAK